MFMTKKQPDGLPIRFTGQPNHDKAPIVGVGTRYDKNLKAFKNPPFRGTSLDNAMDEWNAARYRNLK